MKVKIHDLDFLQQNHYEHDGWFYKDYAGSVTNGLENGNDMFITEEEVGKTFFVDGENSNGYWYLDDLNKDVLIPFWAVSSIIRMKPCEYLYGLKSLREAIQDLLYEDALKVKIQLSKILIEKLIMVDYQRRDYQRINKTLGSQKHNQELLDELE